MIVVQVGVKTEFKISGCRSIHTGVKLGAKQLKVFKIGSKTTQCFWIQL
jgi:hypothetical protein